MSDELPKAEAGRLEQMPKPHGSLLGSMRLEAMLSDAAIASLAKAAPWLGGAFVLCFFVGGWIFWRGSYQEYLDAGDHWEFNLFLAGAAFTLPLVFEAGIIPTVIVIGYVYPAVTGVRVWLDGIRDPTSHNLWPLEVVIAATIGVGIALPAATAGWILRRIISRVFAHDAP